MGKWVAFIKKSYISIRLEYDTLDDLHGFLESFFTGLVRDEDEVHVSIEYVKGEEE